MDLKRSDFILTSAPPSPVNSHWPDFVSENIVSEEGRKAGGLNVNSGTSGVNKGNVFC